MNRTLVFLAVCLLGVGESIGEPPPPREFDFGFLASRQVDLDGDLRFRLLGPVYERVDSGEGRTFRALRPVYARVRDPARAFDRREVLWPLYSARTRKQYYLRRLLLAYHWNFNVADPASAYREWVLPVYFQGRDAQTNNYVAVFPVGGTIHDFLLQDRVSFFLFPLYLSTSAGTVETRSFLWPLFSSSRGSDVKRRNVFPFYGYSEDEGEYVKKYILWPFWTSARYDYPRSSGRAFILFPLFGRVNLEDQKSFMVLPPFFRFARGQRVNLTYCPWPFFQRVSGQVEKFYIWPLWGRRLTSGAETRFFLWPFFRGTTVDEGDTVRKSFMLLPLAYGDARLARSASGDGRVETRSRYFKLWPLFSYRRDEDRRRVRLLELWPPKRVGPVDRSLAPFWTLYTYTAAEEGWDSELLWGLYRRRGRGGESVRGSVFPLLDWERDDRAEPTRKWSVLKGLVGYERRGTQKSAQLLYFLRFGTRETNP